MAIPGLKVVAPSSPRDVLGLLAASIRDPDPVMFFEHKALFAMQEDVPEGEYIDVLGSAAIRRVGDDATLVSLAGMMPHTLAAAELLAAKHDIECTVIDLRSLVPLDIATVLASVRQTSRLVTVEENPRLCGWGAEVVSIIAEEAFFDLDAPIRRVTSPHVPIAFATNLEASQLPGVDRIVEAVRTLG